MDTDTATTSTAGLADGVPAPGTPVPADASPALSTLLGVRTVPDAGSLEDRLASSRLGVAGSLFRALNLKHPPTAKHSLRVALGCSVFAGHLQLDARLREKIEIAALLHDIGKLGVPDQILNKPARLNSDERQLMERHLSFAVHILESFCDDREILDIVRFSGNWYDGSRPDNAEVSGEDLPFGSRILAIQNAFDAMTTDMVYRKALPREKALSELFANTPTQFDPNLVTAFCDANGNCNSQFQAEIVRRWVDMSNANADELWSFATALHQGGTDVQSIFQQRLLESMQDGVLFVDLSARIMVWNRGAQELTGLSRESVHHKQWQPQIIDLRDMEGNAIKVSVCPLLNCLLTLEPSTHRMTIKNCSSGERVAINVHVMPVRDASGTCHGAILVMHDVSPEYTLEERVQNLHTKATRDALTGVGNRAEFDRRHQELVESHLESGEPLGLVICDIDKFKSINDTYGHQAGDAALIDFASLIDRLSRSNDIVARYGGEEFVLLCPGCSSDAAVRKAEEIRRTLAATSQPALKNARMTASFGVTDLLPGDTPEAMLKRADEGLYTAKETGRNRVVNVGSTQDEADTQKAASWFSWGKSREDKLVQRTLRCSVPVELVTEKVRGFIYDNSAEVTAAREGTVELLFDEKNFPGRPAERPFQINMRIELKADVETGSGTLVEVVLTSRRGRDRRLEDLVERADFLVNSLKAYLMAEDY